MRTQRRCLSGHVKLCAASAAELEKAEQHKNSSPVQKLVENGNQGLTSEEIMQKRREEFFSKRMVTTAAKARLHIYSSKGIRAFHF